VGPYIALRLRQVFLLNVLVFLLLVFLIQNVVLEDLLLLDLRAFALLSPSESLKLL